MLKNWMIGAASAVFFGTASFAASAAPVGAGAQVKDWLQANSAVEKADYQRCWQHNGVRRCKWFADEYIGRPRPEEFPTGSTAWWRAMDYEGRGGHGRGR